MTELLLVRHGQAPHNVAGRWEGWSDTPLTKRGWDQAQALARRLGAWQPKVHHVYTSPLRRARQTAAPIATELGVKAHVHEGLREINFGQVGGHTLDSFRESMPELYARWQKKSDLTFQFPEGEQRRAFFRRVGQAVDEIVARHPGDRVVAVAHGGTLRAALAHLFPDTMTEWWAYSLGNASVTHACLQDGRNELLALNDRRHLDGRDG